MQQVREFDVDLDLVWPTIGRLLGVRVEVGVESLPLLDLHDKRPDLDETLVRERRGVGGDLRGGDGVEQHMRGFSAGSRSGHATRISAHFEQTVRVHPCKAQSGT
ncbi:hypothetical protein ACFPRL_14905 [Pseudoclavibacter helvolus]